MKLNTNNILDVSGNPTLRYFYSFEAGNCVKKCRFNKKWVRNPNQMFGVRLNK